MTPRFEIESLGPHGLTVRATESSEAVWRHLLALEQSLRAEPLPGCVDLVLGYHSLTLHFDRRLTRWFPPPDRWRRWLKKRIQSVTTSSPLSGRRHDVPVHLGVLPYDDLAELAAGTGLAQDVWLERFFAAEYTVRAVGFAPGFPYLAGLPPALAHPRRATPRVRVEAGSVAIGADQVGIYPAVSPGGWNIVGYTPVPLFDPDHPSHPARFAPGDRVRFFHALPAVTASVADARPAAPRKPPALGLRLVSASSHTTVQDLGRWGHQHEGVSPSGAVDGASLIAANLVLGNRADAAALECTWTTPTLAFDRDTWVAFAGATVADRTPLRPWFQPAGSTLALGPLVSGARLYLAFVGGLPVPLRLGSRSQQRALAWHADLPTPLPSGTSLPLAAPARPQLAQASFFITTPPPTTAAPLELAFHPSTAWSRLPRTTRQAFCAQVFHLDARSDRMGVRFQEKVTGHDTAALPPSEGVAEGTLQLPPDGRPLVLLAERQTMGGYRKLGVLTETALARLAQARPGTATRFVVMAKGVSASPAHAELWRQKVALRAHPHTPGRTIDLNVDAGEGSEHERELFALATSCNIACGGHAGNATSMGATLRLARQHGLAIGAHPSYPDRTSFGRRETGLPADRIGELVARQLCRLQRCADSAGAVVSHVKPHGALYHRVAHDPAAATALVARLQEEFPTWVLYTFAGSHLATVARAAGLLVYEEGFIDRGYEANGRLRERSRPGAVLASPADGAAQAVSLALHGRPVGSNAATTLLPHTLCVHGDGPHAVAMLSTARDALTQAGIQLGSYLD